MDSDVLTKVYKFRWRVWVESSHDRRLVELDAMVLDSELWKDRPESKDARWSGFSSGPVTLALRFVE